MYTSPSTYNIVTNISNPLAQEISFGGSSILSPVVIINYIAFIMFWVIIFTQFRKTLFPEQDFALISFSMFILITILTFSIVSFIS